ncbi:MAG: hypothetical protein LN561_06645 [Rickettsia endosymbiont of Labidopullus appendiculatus]|nr:hypothetical protein [Rickettsia endosymbiont of Labidopullus appendiculatus]
MMDSVATIKQQLLSSSNEGMKMVFDLLLPIYNTDGTISTDYMLVIAVFLVFPGLLGFCVKTIKNITRFIGSKR